MARASRAARARSSRGGKFIQQAIKRPGALTRKAKAAGQSIFAFARSHAKGKTRTAYQSRFYLHVLRPLAKRRKKG